MRDNKILLLLPALIISQLSAGYCSDPRTSLISLDTKNFTQLKSEYPHFVPLPRVQVQVVEVVHSGLLQGSRAWFKSPDEVWGLTG